MYKKVLGLIISCVAVGVVAKGDIQKGEQLAAQCVACHGDKGNSVVPNFPKLAGQNAKYTIKQLQDMNVAHSQGGRPVPEMIGILMNLSEADYVDLAAYFEAQPIQGGAADPELVALGEKIYRGGIIDKSVAACSGCHGPSGLGNKGAGFPALAGQHAEYIEKQLYAFRLGYDQPQQDAARVNDSDAKIMRASASRMSDLEIKAVSSFISGLR